MSKKCEKCNTENINSALYCKECGNKIKIDLGNEEKIEVKKEKNTYKILFFSTMVFLFSGILLYFFNNNKYNSEVIVEGNSTMIDEPSQIALTSEEIFKKAKKSIITVIASRLDGTIQGSGVVISKDKIITNCHVIDGAESVKVLFENSEYEVNSIYGNKDFDYCILTVSNLPANSANISDKNISVGQKVYSIGTPKGFELTIADGLVSGLRKIENISIIQTTSPISDGSSGGGLFNEYGQLIGITTMMLKDAQNINFAIPADLNKTIKLSKIESKIDTSKYLEQNTIFTQTNIKYFLEVYFQTNCFRSIDEVGIFFSNDVYKYFNFTNPTHQSIFNENISYCQKWTTMSYELDNFVIKNVKANNAIEVDIIAQVSYGVSNELKTINGTVYLQITLVDEFGKIKIKNITTLKNNRHATTNKNYINPAQDKMSSYAYEMITGESIFNPNDIKITINSKNKKIYCVSNICKTEDEVREYINSN